MKKSVALILLSLLVLTGCSKTKTVEKMDYTNEINELNLSVDKYEYMESFEDYLNDGTMNDLISNSLKPNNTETDTEEPEDTGITNPDNDLPPDFGIEDEEIYGEEDYPIVDIMGNIIGYGSKEDSDASFEDFEAQPYYTVQTMDIYNGIAIAKVWNKGLQQLVVYEITLNSNMQIESYMEIHNG